MASYFVKISVDLPESEEVALMSDATGESVDAVLGKLVRFWRWVERHCGSSRGVTRVTSRVTLARVTGVTEAFIDALREVDWLRNENGVFVIPGWEKRFSHTASEKMSNADRQRRYRERKKAGESVTDSRNDSSRNAVTFPLPEKEREKEVIPPIVPQGGRKYTGAFEEFWKAYPRHVGKERAFKAWGKALKRIGGDSSQAATRIISAAVEFSTSPVGRGDYCPHPSSWLNAGQYDDDPSEWNRASGALAVEPTKQQALTSDELREWRP